MKHSPRAATRVNCNVDAVLIHLPRLHEAKLIDISRGGGLLLLAGAADIEIGNAARLRVLNERGNQAFEMDALVVHRSGQLVGLEFHCINRYVQTWVQRLIGGVEGETDLAERALAAMIDPVYAPYPAQTARIQCGQENRFIRNR